jgi:hypothetical protein
MFCRVKRAQRRRPLGEHAASSLQHECTKLTTFRKVNMRELSQVTMVHSPAPQLEPNNGESVRYWCHTVVPVFSHARFE